MCDSAQPQADGSANQPGIETGDYGGGEWYEQGDVQTDAQTGAEEAWAQPDADASPSDSEPFLTVKYNKEEMPLSREAAVTYAQKGMNYDKLSSRLKMASEMLGAYESDDFFKIAKAYSDKSKRSMGDVMNSMRQQVSAALDPQAGKQAVVDVQLSEFMHAYPGVDPRRLPKGVLDAWGTGVPLGRAFLAYQAGAYRDEAAAQKTALQRENTNRRNAQASMGRPQSRGRAHERPLSEDAIKTMSPRELERNHDRIWSFLTGANKERGN